MNFTEIKLRAQDATGPNHFEYRVEEAHTPPEGEVVVTLTLKGAKVDSSSVFQGIESVVYSFDEAEMSFGEAKKSKGKKWDDDQAETVRGLKNDLSAAQRDVTRLTGDLETKDKQLATSAETIQNLGGENEGLKANNASLQARVAELEAAAGKGSESSDPAPAPVAEKPAAKKAKKAKAKKA